ncbi:MAG: hypothetical protein ACI3XJ_01075 [Oscillospiraceae bacterium]
MPGGMGGMGGGLLGNLMKGAMGGMNNQSAGRTQAVEPIIDDYDVARWQRADGLDAPSTMVQAVRADWDRKKAEEQKKSPLKKLLSKFSREKDPKSAAASESEFRPAGGTIVTPEMKKASQRINPAAERDTAVQQTEPPKYPNKYDSERQNYLGLSFQTELGEFFTANPINSAILAVDNLGMGVLALNQVIGAPKKDVFSEKPRDPAGQPLPGKEQADGLQNLIAQRAGTNYMNEFRESREQQKYNVRIRE